MRIEVDYDRCIGSGVCVFTAPKAFDQDDDGRAILLGGYMEAEDLEVLEEAIAACPTRALSFRDDE